MYWYDSELRCGTGAVLTGKKNGQNSVELVKVPCLAKECPELVQPYLLLCKLCYLQCMAGKVPTLVLRDNMGNAVFNPRTKVLDFPSGVSQSRFPKKGMKKGKKVLMMGFSSLCRSSQQIPSVAVTSLGDEFSGSSDSNPKVPTI